MAHRLSDLLKLLEEYVYLNFLSYKLIALRLGKTELQTADFRSALLDFERKAQELGTLGVDTEGLTKYLAGHSALKKVVNLSKRETSRVQGEVKEIKNRWISYATRDELPENVRLSLKIMLELAI
jgi:hypothetical protein